MVICGGLTSPNNCTLPTKMDFIPQHLTPIIVALIGLFGGGGIVYLIIQNLFLRRQIKASAQKTEGEAAVQSATAEKIKGENERATDEHRLNALQKAQETIQHSYETLQKRDEEMARTREQWRKEREEIRRQLDDAHEQIADAQKTIIGKNAVIQYQKEENHEFSEKMQLERAEKKKWQEDYKKLDIEYENFKVRHSECNVARLER